MRGPNNGGDRGNRIDNRARGNAAQLLEKYKNLARDAQTQGDRVMTEYYNQFADHYFRVLAESRSRFEDQNQQHQQRRQRFDNEDFDGEGYEGEAGDEAASEAEAREQQGEQQNYRRDRGDREGNNREDRGNRRDNRDERGDREDRGNRRERRDYREPVAASPVAEDAPVAQAELPITATEDEAPKPRRGRPRKVKAEDADAPQRIEVDRLPPSFSASAEQPANGHAEDAAEPAPRKRRTRRPASEADVAA